MKDVHTMDSDKMIHVEWNEYGQLIRDVGQSFMSFLTSLTKFYEQLPVSVNDWRKISKTTKLELWEYTKVILISISSMIWHLFL